jgi:phosphomannomutase
LPENLHDLCQTVKDNKADAGFATDPDADRLAIVSEAGVPLGEEYTLVLAAEGYMKLKDTPETFVVNQSTSMALEKTAEKYGYKVVRASVGEINVVKKMLELKSNFGGEGNGGIILKEAHLGRDSLVAVTLVLNRMAQDESPLSKIFSDLPQFKIIKDKVNLETIDIDSALINVKERFCNVDMNTDDGIKFIWEDKWIHLRKSNTEPIMRIYAEAVETSEALHLIKGVKSAFTQKN